MNRAGEPYGISFGELSLVSNSHLALEAGEFAKDAGKFHEYHDRVFRAYFSELQEIGNPDVLVKLAVEAGLDAADLQTALKTGKYAQRLQQAREEAEKHSITAVPTFIIGGKHKIVGAQPMNVFRERLRPAQSD
jgi:predicted DsbA family dithiol-disulfide isomerase